MSLCYRIAQKDSTFTNEEIKREAIERIRDLRKRVRRRRELIVELFLRIQQNQGVDLGILWFLVKYKFNSLLKFTLDNFYLSKKQRIRSVHNFTENIINVDALPKNVLLKDVNEITIVVKIYSIRSDNLELFNELHNKDRINLRHLYEAVSYGSYGIVKKILSLHPERIVTKRPTFEEINENKNEYNLYYLLHVNSNLSNSIKVFKLLYNLREEEFLKDKEEYFSYFFDNAIYNQSEDYIYYLISKGFKIDGYTRKFIQENQDVSRFLESISVLDLILELN